MPDIAYFVVVENLYKLFSGFKDNRSTIVRQIVQIERFENEFEG